MNSFVMKDVRLNDSSGEDKEEKRRCEADGDPDEAYWRHKKKEGAMESVRGKVRDRPLTTMSTTLALLPGLKRFEILKSSNRRSRFKFLLA